MPCPENIIPPKKGEVRNPNGRPKGARGRATIVREIIEQIMEAKHPISKEKLNMHITDVLVWKQVDKAIKGDTVAFKELMDSAFGKIKDVQDTNVSINKFDISKIYDPNETQTEVEPTGE